MNKGNFAWLHSGIFFLLQQPGERVRGGAVPPRHKKSFFEKDAVLLRHVAERNEVNVAVHVEVGEWVVF